MAILDSRLTPFIQMLADEGLDWLAFELIDGISRGREPVESSKALIAARGRARGVETENISPDPEGAPETEAILGDEQLEWAAHYVEERLKESLAEMQVALGNLDDIASAAGSREQDTASPDVHSIIVLQGSDDVDDVHKVSLPDVESAQANLPKLKQVLETWLESARSADTQ